MVRHYRVVTGFLNAKYRHNLTSFRRPEKVFVFGEEAAFYAARTPRREKSMGVIVEEKTWDFRLLSVEFC